MEEVEAANEQGVNSMRVDAVVEESIAQAFLRTLGGRGYEREKVREREINHATNKTTGKRGIALIIVIIERERRKKKFLTQKN